MPSEYPTLLTDFAGLKSGDNCHGDKMSILPSFNKHIYRSHKHTSLSLTFMQIYTFLHLQKWGIFDQFS